MSPGPEALCWISLMRFVRFLADFLLALAFLCCHYIFDSYVTFLTLSFNTILCNSIHINFWCIHSPEQSLFWPHSNRFWGYSQGKKHPYIKLQCFRKVWIWTFGWLVHQINSIYEVLKLNQNFQKRKVVTGNCSLW